MNTLVPYVLVLSGYLTVTISGRSGASGEEVGAAINALAGLIAILALAALAIRGTYLIFKYLFHAAAVLLTVIAVLLFVVIGSLNR